MATSSLHLERPERRNRAQDLVRALLVAAATAVLVVVAYAFLQKSVFVHDDLQRGQRFAKLTEASMLDCTRATRAFYGEPNFGYGSSRTSRGARAFFEGCSGVPLND
jgi:hypothetical protein